MDSSMNNISMYYFFLVLCLIVFILCKFIQRWRNHGCYILHYECFKPSDDRKIDTQISGDIIQRNKYLGPEEYRFLLRAVVNSGIGEETYAPRNIVEGRENCATLVDGIEEMEECFFNTLEKLFAKSGVSPAEIDVLVVNVSMLSPAPSLCSRIVRRFAMREDVRAFNLSGMGCSASLISVNLVENMFKCRRNIFAIVVTSESIAPFWYSGNEKSMMLANCLFRSGGCSILLTNRHNLRSKSIMKLKCSERTHLGENHEAFNCCMQKEDDNGRLGFYLSKTLPRAASRAFAENLRNLAPRILPFRQIVEHLARTSFQTLLTKTNISKKAMEPRVINFKSGVDHFCLHPGGSALIEGIKKNLGLTEYDVEPSKMTLSRFGNTSASSIWYVLGYMEAKKRLKKGDRVLMVSLGAGFKCNSILWEVMRDLGNDNNNDTIWKGFIDDYPPRGNTINPYLKNLGWLCQENPPQFKSIN
nr:3-ketoacyl-CoA synthase 12-like [Ipomoea batatas]GMC65591.1 3-ketoacyl-CoA synthase 12-like [Ipomoea batatas]GMD24939.1 3-ketoacyl-CoA synthase 12-like [Ipomoea batatas]